MASTIRNWTEKSTSEYTDLHVSVGFIIGTCLAAEFTRLCIKWVLKDPQGLARILLMECLATAEMCATCFEVGVSKYDISKKKLVPKNKKMLDFLIDTTLGNYPLAKIIFLKFMWCPVADNYGVGWYAVVLYFMCLWWCLFWEDATACPYTHLEDLVQGQSGFKITTLVILTEILGGIAAYPLYVKKFWLYKFIPTHARRIYQNRCPADLTVEKNFFKEA